MLGAVRPSGARAAASPRSPGQRGPQAAAPEISSERLGSQRSAPTSRPPRAGVETGSAGADATSFVHSFALPEDAAADEETGDGRL